MSSKTIKTILSIVKYNSILMILLFANNLFAADISEKIKSYITNIKSIAVEFKQYDQNGSMSEGMLIIDKPHKFRCNYYHPFPIVIIGNKNYVSVYDYEMGHLSRINSSENIFNFLLTDKVNFDDQFEILSTSELGENYVMRIKKEDLNKTTEISFDKKSGAIKSMVIYEDNNIITLVFDDIRKIYDVKKNLFDIKDPDIYGRPERLNKKDLQKRFKITT